MYGVWHLHHTTILAVIRDMMVDCTSVTNLILPSLSVSGISGMFVLPLAGPAHTFNHILWMWLKTIAVIMNRRGCPN